MGTPGALSNHFIVLFDGMCNLCTGSVQFIIKRDPASKFRFASLQSEVGRSLLRSHGLDTDVLHSIVLISGNDSYQRSDAALLIAKHLSGIWPVFYAFKILPRFLRDRCYNIVSRYRYNMFGKKDECWLPSPELSARFL